MGDLTVTDNHAEGQFEVRDADGGVLGFAVYVLDVDAVVVTHVEVVEAAEGRGVGSALARGALDQVRASGRVVVPLCPFIRAYIERHPEYQDLVRHTPGATD
ncbi:MAG: GNAT family N-acetyltransferase [Cellulomonas sp.]